MVCSWTFFLQILIDFDFLYPGKICFSLLSFVVLGSYDAGILEIMICEPVIHHFDCEKFARKKKKKKAGTAIGVQQITQYSWIQNCITLISPFPFWNLKITLAVTAIDPATKNVIWGRKYERRSRDLEKLKKKAPPLHFMSMLRKKSYRVCAEGLPRRQTPARE